jgi:hypothetical protein
MPGVRYTEPMHGMVLLERTRTKLTEGPEVTYFSDTTASTLRETPTAALRELADKYEFYGDFARREKVESCVRVIFRDAAEVRGTLFMNFNKRIDFESRAAATTRKRIRKLIGDVKSQFDFLEIFSSLSQEDRPLPWRLVSVLKLTELLASIWRRPDAVSGGDPLKHSFELVLERVLRAFEIDTEEALGTIHRYHPEDDTLEVCGCIGAQSPEPDRQSMKKGEGIVSWVAWKRGAILIEDLQQSRFREVYIPLGKDTTSELAVPMLAGEELLGVLNLESVRKNAFTPQDLRTLWYAANSAAIACELSQHAAAERQFRHKVEELKDKAFPKELDPPIPGLSVAAVSHPWGALIGGDIYQFVRSDSKRNRLFGLVADAEGKGYGAALAALPMLAAFRVFCKETASTKYVMERLVEMGGDLGIAISVLCFFIDLEARDSQNEPMPLISACSAGHFPLMIISPGGSNRDFPDPNGPAQSVVITRDGTELALVVAEEVTALKEGDVVIAYTDGIHDAPVGGDAFGRQGILTAALQCLAEPAGRIAAAVYDAAKRHAEDNVGDDATVVVVKLEELPQAAQ